MPRTIRLGALAGLVMVLATACGANGGARAPSPSGPSGAAGASGTVTVLAAASLADAFTKIAVAFEARNLDVEVALSFDGSSRLATQILEGVPGDVFASADMANLAKVVKAGEVSGREVTFATNELEIVVQHGNPLGIGGLDDLTSGIVLALCRADVPCGAYAASAFKLAGLAVPAASREDSVKAVLTRVQLGEADAGVVYRSDVQSAEDVTGVELAGPEQVRATYSAAVLADASNPSAGAAFLAFLVSDEAQMILEDEGFGRP